MSDLTQRSLLKVSSGPFLDKVERVGQMSNKNTSGTPQGALEAIGTMKDGSGIATLT